jgi:catechol 2,3-dioxygenase-like lactoylglutathione lyase family enzyme
MPLHRIDHITLNSSDLAKTCAFYADALGFTVQPMEGLGYQGAWLLLGDHPYVHVISRPPAQPAETPGQVDHFALEATDPIEVRQRLARSGVGFRENPLQDLGLHQIVVQDPDGMKVELNFRGVAAREA